MRHLSSLLSALLVAGASLAPSAWADTVADKPRLSIQIQGGNANFRRDLLARLDDTHRFNVVDRPTLASKLREARIELAAGISVQQSLAARKLADTDLVLDAEVRQAAGDVRITTRLFDLRTGEYSRDLALIGRSEDLKTLAGQLANFVRHSVPIRCLIKDMNEDQVIIDLGAMDGVQVGSYYRVFRHPQNMKPVEIGLVRVSAVEPFGALADVEESAKGVRFQAGDALIERTSGLLVSKP